MSVHVPTYEELLGRCKVDSSLMEQTFSDDHLMEFGSQLDEWEKLAFCFKIPSPEIEEIKSQGGKGMKGIRVLQYWKQRCGSMATYKVLVEALLQISRTDLSEKVILFQAVTKSQPNHSETRLVTLTGIEEKCLSTAMSPSFFLASTDECMAQTVMETLRELEEEFYDLVVFIEDTLENSKVRLNTIIRRFRMLPQSIRRQHETDENYKETRRRILDSKTVKTLFDNLTELKHWNYMMPETLAHILKDVQIDDVHKKINKYKVKLMAFKANTKLKELIGISFPVPDYCMELAMEVQGWEDKTIQEVENRAVNIVRRATYSGSPHISLGWKGVNPGSIKVAFILIESVKLIPEKFFEDSSISSVQFDGDIFHSKDYTKVKHTNLTCNTWCTASACRCQVGYGIALEE